MKTQLIVEMPDRSLWSVPVMIIARNRAENYKSEFGDDLQRSLDEDTVPLFTEDEYNITDWAANNMNWSDVKAFATQVQREPEPVDWEEGWMNGKKTLV